MEMWKEPHQTPSIAISYKSKRKERFSKDYAVFGILREPHIKYALERVEIRK